jgi:hypothetical protein
MTLHIVNFLGELFAFFRMDDLIYGDVCLLS